MGNVLQQACRVIRLHLRNVCLVLSSWLYRPTDTSTSYPWRIRGICAALFFPARDTTNTSGVFVTFLHQFGHAIVTSISIRY